jgi:hypothetical protein
MPFRIRMRAGGDLEVEVDTPGEVQQLLEVALPRRHGEPLRLALPAGPPVVEAPAPRRAYRKRREGVRRGRPRVDKARGMVSRRPREAPPVSVGASDHEGIVRLLQRGPLKSGEIAKKVGWLRPRVTRALQDLEAQGRVHSTGVRAGTRWHAGAASAPQTPSASRRPV